MSRELLEVYVYNRPGQTRPGTRYPEERAIPANVIMVNDGISLKFYRDTSLSVRDRSTEKTRNKLAAEAMKALIGRCDYRPEDVDALVKKSYEIADAMMTERAK